MNSSRQVRWLTILLTVGVVLLGAVSAWSATTWTVDDDDPAADFSSIQDAINATLSGDTIEVADGTYTITEAITVDKGVTITGNTGSPENVVVTYASPQSTHHGFKITTNNVTVEGVKVINGNTGFYLTGVTGCRVSNCIVGSCADKGIYVRQCPATSEATRVEVTGNIISDCGNTWGAACIQTYGSPYTYIYNNTINATEDKGINIIRSGATGTADRVQVIGNTISETKWPGIQVIGAPYTYVYNNTLTQCNYYGGDGTGDWDYASIHVQDDGAIAGDNVIVDSNTVSNGINGIQTWSNYISITNNNIYDMGTTYDDTKTTGDGTYKNSGILVGSMYGDDPTGVVIDNNNIYDNYWGLFYSADLTNGVTAENNYWGDMDPSDDVSANVDYSPWWGADYIGDDHSNPWTWGTDDNIQDAIDVASADDSIYVVPGTYYENVDLNTPGVYLWTNPGAVIDGGGVSDAVTVTADGTTIEGFEIRNGNDDGIEVAGVDNNTITDNEIHSNDCAIFITEGDWNEILSNALHDNVLYGIQLFLSDNNTIDGNTIYLNETGIHLMSADSNLIANNVIHDNFWEGVYLSDWSSGNTIEDNAIYSHFAGVLLVDATGNFIGSNVIHDNFFGIYLLVGDDTPIVGNDVYNNATGIYINDSYAHALFGNHIQNNDYGIYQEGDSIENTLHGNAIVGNTTAGVWNDDMDLACIIDAALNWWGDVNGPAHADNTNPTTGDAVSDNVIYSPWLGIGTDAEPGTVGWQAISPMLIIVDDVGPVPPAETVLGQVINTVAGYLNRAIGAANLSLGTDTIEVKHGTYDGSEPITEAVNIVSETGSASHTTVNGNVSINGNGVLVGLPMQGFRMNGNVTVDVGANAATSRINWCDVYGNMTNNGTGTFDAQYNYWGTLLESVVDSRTTGAIDYDPFLPKNADDSYVDATAIIAAGLAAGIDPAIDQLWLMVQLGQDVSTFIGYAGVAGAGAFAGAPAGAAINLGGAAGGGGAVEGAISGTYTLGEPIDGRFTLTDPVTGEPITDAAVTTSLLGPDGALVFWGCAIYDETTGEYVFTIDTSGLAPGTYELIIQTDDGQSKTVSIEVLAA